jgi:hypothetical protein
VFFSSEKSEKFIIFNDFLTEFLKIGAAILMSTVGQETAPYNWLSSFFSQQFHNYQKITPLGDRKWELWRGVPGQALRDRGDGRHQEGSAGQAVRNRVGKNPGLKKPV